MTTARVLALLLAAAACGKSPRVGPAVAWHTLDEAEALAKTEKKPLLLHFQPTGAPDDRAFDTLPVREALADFIAVRVVTNREESAYRGYDWRFGAPRTSTTSTTMALGTFADVPHAARYASPNELYRTESLPPPRELAAKLREAKRHHDARLARAEARRARALAKTPRPRIDWVRDDVDRPLARARREQRPVLVFVGAEWDKGSKELEESFADPEVAMIVADTFIAVALDISDDEKPTVNRWCRELAIKGTPTILTLASDGTRTREWNTYMPADVLAGNLAE
ncbi:MAG: thioredoxin family protein [Labilithrix sp.]|nr:thioredoxin family protein [Labilithrix sp.]MCW5815829.1 thioredoxin family protein [Labilithrix sp.]